MVERVAAEPASIVVIMGVSGSGKSTVAEHLARHLGWDLQEGDDLHPASNVAKMRSGIPLTDADRGPWLDLVAAWISAHRAAGTPGIITCSALRRAYRDRLRGPGVVFVHLDGTPEQIDDRLSARRHHFMPESLLSSQLDTLEPLEPDEDGIVVSIEESPESQVREIIRRLDVRGRD